MDTEAPAVVQDQPSSTPLDLDAVLAAAGVPRSIPPELLKFARETDLQLRVEPGVGPALTDPPANEADPDGEGEGEETPVSLDDFDPAEIPDDADRNWFEERVKAFQGDYTRKTQELGQTRQAAEQNEQILLALQNPQTAPEILRLLNLDPQVVIDALGFELDDGSGAQEDDEALLDPDERIDRVEQRLAQEAQARQEEGLQRQEIERENAEADHIESTIGALEDSEDTEFGKEEVSFLTTYARVHPLPSGAPDVRGAYELLKNIGRRQQQEWVESKKQGRRRTPGVPAVKAADLATEEGRMKVAEAAARATRASQE